MPPDLPSNIDTLADNKITHAILIFLSKQKQKVYKTAFKEKIYIYIYIYRERERGCMIFYGELQVSKKKYGS